jgi:GNAT acetyltransferase-like protein
MIRIAGRGAVYGEVWYEEQPPRDCGVDVVIYRQREAPLEGARTVPFRSIITDLSPKEDAITGQFGKDCRYKIRRAEARDGLAMEWLAEPQARLDEFSAFYDSFARERSIWLSDRRWLAAACAAGQLVLTSASRDGETLAWHAYLVCGKSAWLQYTASSFRNGNGDHRALVGRTNRWLHWKEMLQFKELGVERYDWGGLFEDESAPENAGINNFKRDFGGREVRTYDCTAPVTLRGRVWLGLRDAWRRRRVGAAQAS